MPPGKQMMMRMMVGWVLSRYHRNRFKRFFYFFFSLLLPCRTFFWFESYSSLLYSYQASSLRSLSLRKQGKKEREVDVIIQEWKNSSQKLTASKVKFFFSFISSKSRRHFSAQNVYFKGRDEIEQAEDNQIRRPVQRYWAPNQELILLLTIWQLQLDFCSSSK